VSKNFWNDKNNSCCLPFTDKFPNLNLVIPLVTALPARHFSSQNAFSETIPSKALNKIQEHKPVGIYLKLIGKT
jgi:hypothetical protein